MNTLIRKQKKPSDLRKLLGYTALLALVFQLIIPGIFGIGMGIHTASAQAVATTTLTVTKVVDNTAGGSAVVGDFDLFVTSDTGTTTQVTSGAATEFETGDYTVSESNIEGYEATFSGDCNPVDGTVTLTEGVAANCTITNTFVSTTTATTTSLTVTKVVDNTAGGDAVVTDFDLFVDGIPVTSGVATTTLEAGPHVVTETDDPDYTATFSGDCDPDGNVTLEEGDDLNCTITNTFTGTTTATTTSLMVTKVVDNTAGGSAVVGDFPLFINGMEVTSGEATTTLAAGTYTITETGDPDYIATFSGDCDADGMVTLAEGDELECTITNTFGTTTATTTSITVTKVVNGGSMTVEDFPLFINGVEVTSGEATTTLAAGTYFISENGNANYTAVFSGDCAANGSIVLAEGDELECVITNTFNATATATTTPTATNINVTGGSGGSASATGGDVTVILGATSTVPTFFPFTTFPGQVLGAQSFIPVPFAGQVLGAQSAVPGLPTTGGDPTAGATSSLPNVALVTLAGLLAMAGAGLILSPRSSSSTSGRNREL